MRSRCPCPASLVPRSLFKIPAGKQHSLRHCSWPVRQSGNKAAASHPPADSGSVGWVQLHNFLTTADRRASQLRLDLSIRFGPQGWRKINMVPKQGRPRLHVQFGFRDSVILAPSCFGFMDSAAPSNKFPPTFANHRRGTSGPSAVKPLYIQIAVRSRLWARCVCSKLSAPRCGAHHSC